MSSRHRPVPLNDRSSEPVWMKALRRARTVSSTGFPSADVATLRTRHGDPFLLCLRCLTCHRRCFESRYYKQADSTTDLFIFAEARPGTSSRRHLDQTAHKGPHRRCQCVSLREVSPLLGHTCPIAVPGHSEFGRRSWTRQGSVEILRGFGSCRSTPRRASNQPVRSALIWVSL